jgi:hypothetical protein
MDNQTLTLVQEVYFDLCDLLDNNELDQPIEGFTCEFDTLRELIEEQKKKLAEIELRLDIKERV